MASLNLDSILAKVDYWKESDKGRKRMKKTLDNYVRNNVGKTQAGSPVLTRKAINDYGNKLIQAIQNTALSCDLPDSVAAHFSSLKRGRTTILPDGSYVMEISFTDDLTRESLEPQRYGGVRNIVAIFNNGYPADAGRSEAISNVYGWWHGNYIHALGARQGLHFMQTAVEDFNQTYGSQFGIHATVGEIYSE